MRQLDFISLIHKELTGDISSAESTFLADWLKSDSKNVETYEHIKTLWEASSGLRLDFTPNHELAFQKHLERINSEKEFRPEVIRVKPVIWVLRAAAVLLLIVSALVIWNVVLDTKSFQAENEIVEATLDDGSKVWLNRGAILSFDKDFSKENRNVTLKGEAFFDVKNDQNNPFTINVGSSKILVLGTSFNVKSEENGLIKSVAVESGKVSVEHKAMKKIVDAQQKLIVSDDILSLVKLEDQNDITWKDGIIQFNETPLSEALKGMKSLYGINVELKEDIAECTISSTKPLEETFEDLMKIITASHKVEWDWKDEKTIIVHSVKCNY